MGLEVSSQPLAAVIEVGGSRRSSCSKLLAEDSVIPEMVTVHLFSTMGNVTYTVNGQRYASLLEQFVIPALHARLYDTVIVFMHTHRPLRETTASPLFR